MRGALALSISLYGCALEDTDAAAAPAVNCERSPSVAWENWAHGFFLTYCASCHAAGAPIRYGAPEAVNFDVEADVRAWAERVRFRVIDNASMPIGGGVPPDDLQLLDIYLTCEL